MREGRETWLTPPLCCHPGHPAGPTLWFHQVHLQMGNGWLKAEGFPRQHTGCTRASGDGASFSATNLQAAPSPGGCAATRQGALDLLPSLPCFGPADTSRSRSSTPN